MKKKIFAVIMTLILALSVAGSTAAYSYLSGSDAEESSITVDESLIRE